MDYYLTIKRNEVLIYSATSIKVETIMVFVKEARHLRSCILRYRLYEIPRIGKSIKTSGCQGLRKRTEEWRERGYSFWVIETSRIDHN